jgi:hypothetical protein
MTTRPQQQQPSQFTAAERVAQINKQLDSLDDDVFDLLHAVNEHATQYGWGSRLVLDGLDAIDTMKARQKELEEQRRQVRAATQTTLAS